MNMRLFPSAFFFWGFVVIGVAAALAYAIPRVDFLRESMRRLGSIGEPRYAPQAILTDNETEFFRRLQQALPQAYIFPQVALSALIRPTSRGNQNLHDFRRISQKRVDYAVYTNDLQLVAIIELDDRTHVAIKDAQRDRFVASAGIRTLRFESKHKPSVEQIRATVFAASAVASNAG